MDKELTDETVSPFGARLGELESIMRDLTRTVAAEGNTHVVFGDPLELDHHKVIPVAKVQIGFGGGLGMTRPGAGGRLGAAVGKLFGGFGGGGGGGIHVTPIGFIYEHADRVVFEPIVEITAVRKR